MIVFRPFAVCVVLAVAGLVRAQVDTITEARVREVVSWLAADERKGRDTGSPELVAAGEWIAARFATAGLQQVREGSWQHEFTLPGWQLDATAITATLVGKGRDEKRYEVVLAPDADVRQWTVSDVVAGKAEPCTVGRIDDPVLQRMLNAQSARQPVVVEVAAEHPFWQQAKGKRRVLGNKRQASRPVLLVREGLLPPPPADGSEVAWTLDWSVPAAEKVEVPQWNVMACVRGSTKPDEYVLVSAHYDHVGVGREVDGDRIYNGADDDASGTTAVVLLAEALAKAKPARSILFVCFTGEERGLLGSKAFAAEPPVPLAKIVANLNIEMIGRPEPGKEGKAWITGADLSDFAAIAAEVLPPAGVEVVPFEMAARLFTASDNWSLAQKGVVAHSLSAGSLHRDYHQPSDEVDKLDIVHMTRIVRGLHAFTLALADREQPPQWNEQGKQRIAGRRRGG